MTPREERGLIIAALHKVRLDNGDWIVPSQFSDGKTYRVNVQKQSCNCLDHTETGLKCKHQFAVEFTIKREHGADGTVSETREIKFAEKITYTQDWRAYNRAQTTEKHRFQVLLADLASGVKQPPREAGVRGRKPVLLSDAVFATVYKVFSTFSSRRFSCDLKDAAERGYLSKAMHFNSINRYLESDELTPILSGLIGKSALPLAAVERDFAVDSSGFSSSRFVRWFDEKYGCTREKHDWIKCHICCGIKTNIVTSVRIEGPNAGDAPQFKPLVDATAQGGFKISEVSGDKAYASEENFTAVADHGGLGYLFFKANATGGIGGLYEKMFRYFQFKQEEYLNHYHKRSNVESVFSAVKRVLGSHVRSRTDVSMKNEVLCKFLAHNIRVLIQEQEELGIVPVFWPEGDGQGGRDVLPMIGGR